MITLNELEKVHRTKKMVDLSEIEKGLNSIWRDESCQKMMILQLLESSLSAVTLEHPVVYMERNEDQLFISNKGIVTFQELDTGKYTHHIIHSNPIIFQRTTSLWIN